MIKNYNKFALKNWAKKENGKNFENGCQSLTELENGFFIFVDWQGNYSFHSKGYSLMLKEYLKMYEV